MLMGMINKELSGLRSKILEVLELYQRVKISNQLRWVGVSGVKKSSAVASDSSFTGTLTRYAYIYGIRAFSALFTGSSDDTIRFSRYIVKFDVINPLSIDREEGGGEASIGIGKRVVVHIAKDLEVRAAKMVIDSLKESPDLVLFDGSLRSFLGSWFRSRKVSRISESMRRSWEERVEILKNLMRSSRLVFISKTHSRQILHRYLEPTIDGKPVIVPDYALVGKILERSGGGPGFMEPIRIPGEVEGINYYTLTYAVLSKGSLAYQITTPGSLDIEEMVEIFEMLRYHSIPGYPEPLRQCHLHSRIRRSDFTKLLDTYRIRLSTGREPLGEV